MKTSPYNTINSPDHPLVLGVSWLQKHNPHVNWSSGRVLGWEATCLTNCFWSASLPSTLPELEVEFPDLSGVPEVYMDLKEVFSKTRASSLPPHCPYDCVIDLLPGKKEAMQKYLNDALAAGLIRPSSSPAGAAFFFIGKKDRGLRPCIDFRGLNWITIKSRYPLPLISSAFELVQGARIFTKLDLRSEYHLVRIR